MNLSSSTPSRMAEIWLVKRTRDERSLPGADRLPTVIGLARGGAEAHEALLHLSKLSEERIAELALRSDLDPLSLCDRLEEQGAGDTYEACKFEVDLLDIDILEDLRAMVISQQLHGRV